VPPNTIIKGLTRKREAMFPPSIINAPKIMPTPKAMPKIVAKSIESTPGSLI
jgi:hypothetical protein